jgi:predicted metal-dependent hydrolase
MIERRVRDIDYQLLPGTERRTTDIVIERNGTVVVRPPKNMIPEKVDRVVESKRTWIYRSLAEWRDLNATAVVREWVNGETFLYLGRSYRLSLADDLACPLKLVEGRFFLNRSIISKHGPAGARRAFEAYYTEKALNRINERVAFFARKVAVRPRSVRVADLGYRWASCSAGGDLSFHWKCMMAAGHAIDYLVVHELCHLRHRKHTEAFWNEVDKVLPDYRERKAWLRQYGAALDI